MTKVDNCKLSDESNALMSNGQAEAKGKRFSYIYNKQNGTFLGRTAKAWVQLIVFYVIFYICLATFWLACLMIFLETLDDEVPKYYGKGTIIGINPGVGFQPLLKSNPESTLIKFNQSDSESYKKYVDTLDEFLLKYSNDNYTRICEPGKSSNKDFVKNSKRIDKYANSCRFSLDQFDNTECTSKNTFGFKNGKPCIILLINKLINWTPQEFFENESTNSSEDYSIIFECNGVDDSSKENLGNLNYYPSNGISYIYYPYVVMENYHQPFTIVQFNSLKINKLLLIKCNSYVKNNKDNNKKQIGTTKFELELIQ